MIGILSGSAVVCHGLAVEMTLCDVEVAAASAVEQSAASVTWAVASAAG